MMEVPLYRYTLGKGSLVLRDKDVPELTRKPPGKSPGIARLSRCAAGLLISQKVIIGRFTTVDSRTNSCELVLYIASIKNTLTDLCWDCLLPNDSIETFCEIRFWQLVEGPKQTQFDSL